MYQVSATRLVQRIRQRASLERSRVATDIEVLDAASAGVAWATSILLSTVPGYYDRIVSNPELAFTGSTLQIQDDPQPWRLRQISYAPAGSGNFTPLRVITLEEVVDRAGETGSTPRAAALASGISGEHAIQVIPRTVIASAWEWLVLVSVMPGPIGAQARIALPTPLWEEAIVLYGAIVLSEKQELPTSQLWQHLQALESRMRETMLSRDDSGQANVRQRRPDPLSEELGRWW